MPPLALGPDIDGWRLEAGMMDVEQPKPDSRLITSLYRQNIINTAAERATTGIRARKDPRGWTQTHTHKLTLKANNLHTSYYITSLY